jgi:hypothetical protein
VHEEHEAPVQESFQSSTTLSHDEPETGLGGSFHFMQASELDDGLATGNSALDTPVEGVNGTAHEYAEDKPAAIESADPEVQEHAEPESAAPVNGNLDWAADDADGLEDLNELKVKFGASGQVTPTAPEPQVVEQADGFVPVGGEGRPRGGRGRGGYRGINCLSKTLDEQR